jgi:arginyl-tRNA synthetase
MRKAAEENLAPSDEALDALGPEDVALVKLAAQYPRVVEAAAQAREPHRIAFYLYDLAAAFHAFWNAGNDDPAKRVILTQDPKLSGARLYLVAQIGQVIRNGLGLLGVEAVEEM